MSAKPAISEKSFQSQVIQLARLRGWRVHHIHDSRKSSGSGWPDLSMIRGGRFVAAELKVGGNRPTAEQVEWLADLSECGLETFLWRPSDFEEIERTLR